MKTSWFNKTEIPKPRTMKQLVRSIHPDIYKVSPGCMAYDVGVEAWDVSLVIIYF